MSSAVRRYAPALALLLMASACSEPSFVLHVDFEPRQGIQQIRVRGSDANGPLGEVTAPETAGRALESGETLRLYLPTQYTLPLRFQVDGLKNGERVSSGVLELAVIAPRDSTVWLDAISREPDALQETPVDAGTPQPTPTGGSCAGCEGCCRDGICTAPTFNTCGTGGVSCEKCDSTRANQCSPQGFCACGSRPTCGMTADNCSQGTCRCGTGDECGAGQQCMNGQCVCTPSSCGGCCEGRTCLPGNDKHGCGTGGSTCQKCKKVCLPNGTCE